MGMIAFVWTYLTVNIPVENLNINLSSTDLMLLFLSRFFFISAISIPFDIRDKETDLKDGVRTIAHSLSHKKIRIVIYVLIGLMNVCMYLFGQNRQMPMLILPYIVSSIFTIYVINSKGIQKQKYYYQIYIDGMLILQFILVYIFMWVIN
jgi:4-hydroxybenzoate polyprenyltransferase